MSIIIHIPKTTNDSFKDKAVNEDSVNVDENLETDSINIPKIKQAKANDLSRLEVSMYSSNKYTLSGDEMVSNLSIEIGYMNGRISMSNDEKEIEIETRNVIYITPKKINKSFNSKSICEKNFYNTTQNNESGNNFSSERVLCEELGKGQDHFIDQK